MNEPARVNLKRKVDVKLKRSQAICIRCYQPLTLFRKQARQGKENGLEKNIKHHADEKLTSRSNMRTLRQEEICRKNCRYT
jgi:hypothetical protein